jgi:U4/U6.U5 tri-snRNP-associated protein 2
MSLLEQEIEPSPSKRVKPNEPIVRNDCPYLSTIRRHMLDFDFEKLCSVSLNNLNVYACLVCGKYYQGRAKNTYAYMHSLEADHHVFINLHNTNVQQ